MPRLKKPPTTSVKLVSYSIKMVIPTGQFANIQPEIIVQAGTVEEAHDYIAPHMNKLWKEYFMVSERRPEPEKLKSNLDGYSKATVNHSPASSVAFTKASQAIASCVTQEALDLIQSQIEKSVKLTLDDKAQLLKLSVVRSSELKNGNSIPK